MGQKNCSRFYGPTDARHNLQPKKHRIAMIPVEVGEPSLRRQTLDLDLNKESLLVGLDLINELKDQCRITKEACKLWAARRYNSRVKLRNFQKEDLVWRMRSDARKTGGKFSSKWEGSF